MPALGLLLEEPLFESYNAKVAASNARLSGPEHADWRAPIAFGPGVREKVERFKEEWIYKSMREVEERSGL
jgi:tRNA pseudouridine38-40 synthase